MIVAAGRHGADERFGRFLARAFAGEQLLADIHGEVLGIMRIARRDVRMEMMAVAYAEYYQSKVE